MLEIAKSQARMKQDLASRLRAQVTEAANVLSQASDAAIQNPKRRKVEGSTAGEHESVGEGMEESTHRLIETLRNFCKSHAPPLE